jgi:hypothetical protein
MTAHLERAGSGAAALGVTQEPAQSFSVQIGNVPSL